LIAAMDIGRRSYRRTWQLDISAKNLILPRGFPSPKPAPPPGAPVDQHPAQLPHLATKAELLTGLAELRDDIGKVRTALADKPSRGYLWGVMGAMAGAQAVALAAAALIFAIIRTRPAPLPAPAPRARLVVPAGLVLAAEAFDWDRYNARQDTCHDADRIAA
jgi:hypothetical protein